MTIQSLLQDVLSIYINYQTCPIQPSAYPQCNLLWAIIYIGMAILLSIFFLITLFEMIYYRRAWRSYLKKKAQREAMADPETMAKHMWNGEFSKTNAEMKKAGCNAGFYFFILIL